MILIIIHFIIAVSTLIVNTKTSASIVTMAIIVVIIIIIAVILRVSLLMHAIVVGVVHLYHSLLYDYQISTILLGYGFTAYFPRLLFVGKPIVLRMNGNYL